MLGMTRQHGEADFSTPTMSWLHVDLPALQKHHNDSLEGGKGKRKAQKDQGNDMRSDGGRALAGTSHGQGSRGLKRNLSGPIKWDAIEEDEDPDAQPVDDQEMQGLTEEEVLIETRIRLISGLKRYFHDKRAEGLLSARGIQLLDRACDASMDNDKEPLHMLEMMYTDLCGGWAIRTLAQMLFLLRRYRIAPKRDIFSKGLYSLVRWPSFLLASLLGQVLGGTMLLSIEVAVEYWLALTWCPQAQWLNDAAQKGQLQDEVQHESKKAFKFIIDREVEAPARFQSIQAYRAAMALLRQEARFVDHLFASGMVDEAEHEQLLKPIEKRERRMQRQGALWRVPLISEVCCECTAPNLFSACSQLVGRLVLRNLPFLKHVPEEVFRAVLRQGTLVKYSRDETIWSPPQRVRQVHSPSSSLQHLSAGQSGSDGLYVIMAGLVKSSFVSPDGRTQEFFLGSGGLFGLLHALVDEVVPGSGPCYAVGNALLQASLTPLSVRKEACAVLLTTVWQCTCTATSNQLLLGPVVFHLPQEVVNTIKREAHSNVVLQQMLLDMFRLSGLYVLERLKSEVIACAVTHYQHLAVQQTRTQTLRRLAAREKRHNNAGPFEVGCTELQSRPARQCH
eukprot:jgi/Astpho2/5137/Aster-06348